MFEYSNKRNMLNYFKNNLNFNLVLGVFYVRVEVLGS